MCVSVVYWRRVDEAVGGLRREGEKKRKFTEGVFLSRESPWSQKAQTYRHFRSHCPAYLKTEVLG